jgi:tetratricopeptide (TPR) repeat protein
MHRGPSLRQTRGVGRCRHRNMAVLLPAVALLLRAEPSAAEEGASKPPRARPASDDASGAEQLYAAGVEDFKAQRYDLAIQKFAAGYRLSGAPLFLYNLAQAHRLKGDCAEALTRYRAFLATDPIGTVREHAEAHLAELEPCSGGVEGDRGHGPAVQPPLEGAESGSNDSAKATATSLLETRDRARPAGGLLPPASRSSTVPGDRRPVRKLGAAIGFGTAIVLVSLGGYFGLRARDASDEVSQIYEKRGQWDAAARETEREGKRAEVLSIAGLTGGLLAGGITVCWLSFD